MPARLATEALPRIQAVFRPRPPRPPTTRAFSLLRPYTNPRGHVKSKPWVVVVTKRHLVNVPSTKEAKPKKRLDYSLSKNPNAWIVSDRIKPKSRAGNKAEQNNIGLVHPESQQSLVLNLHALRDACACDKCIDPHSGQKNFGTTEIPDALFVKDYKRLSNASLQVVWDGDLFSGGEPHTSVYTAKTIRSWFKGSREGFFRLPNTTLWDKRLFEASSPMVKYDDWVSGGPGFHAAIAQLWNYGLVFIDGVPKSEESVVTIANQIGHIMETFYGRTWDVRSKPEAENVAYTSTFLGLHQDLLYTKDPPRIQFLHCLENTCEGGESIFSDAHRVANLMELGPSKLFKALSNRRIRYHYKKHGHFYEAIRTVLNKTSNSVFWSPPFQSPDQPLDRSSGGSAYYATWLEAAKKFRELLEDEKYLYEYKLKPGQCVIFDNLRVLHGRRKFDTTTGSRWLKGTYVSRDEWNSKTLTSSKEIRSFSVKDVPSHLAQAAKLNEWHGVWSGSGK